MTEHGFDIEKQEKWQRLAAKVPASTPIAVAVCDLDDFKGINDTYGHEQGDVVLRAWERTLTGNVPKDAIVGRIGGDEYVVAFPGASAENALILMEEIRSHFSAHPPSAELSAAGVSVGIASRPPHGETIEELLAAAKDALMRAKREGRNRVALYVQEKMTLKSNYYTRGSLDRLAKLSANTGRTEASLLREALDDLLDKHRDQT